MAKKCTYRRRKLRMIDTCVGSIDKHQLEPRKAEADDAKAAMREEKAARFLAAAEWP